MLFRSGTDPTKSGVYAATSDGVYKNTKADGTSTSWTPYSTGLPAGPIAALAFETTTQRLIAAAPSGVYVLPAGSTVWGSTAIAVPPSGAFTSIALFGPRIAYLGTTTGAILKVDVTTSTSVVISATGRSKKVAALTRTGDVLVVGDQDSIWECNVSADTCAVPSIPTYTLSGPATRFGSIQGTLFAGTVADGVVRRQASGWAPIIMPTGFNGGSDEVTAIYTASTSITIAVTSNGRTRVKQSPWNPGSPTAFGWADQGTTIPETRVLVPSSVSNGAVASLWAGTLNGPYLLFTDPTKNAVEVSEIGVEIGRAHV